MFRTYLHRVLHCTERADNDPVAKIKEKNRHVIHSVEHCRAMVSHAAMGGAPGIQQLEPRGGWMGLERGPDS